MSEKGPSQENLQNSYNHAIEALKKLSEKGFTSPDELPLVTQDVLQANYLIDIWSKQAWQSALQDPAPGALLEFQLAKTTIYVDAGFLDKDYLDEVANDWLAQDLQTALDKGLVDTATKIQNKIDEISSLLAQ